MNGTSNWGRAVWLAALIGLAGCRGVVTEPAPSDARRGGGSLPPGAACEEPEVPAAQPLRRISSEQYANLLTDLVPGALGRALVERSTFPRTTIQRGFANDAEANAVNTTESNAIEDNAETLAAYILEEADTAIVELASCVEPGFSDTDVDACMPTFIEEVGARAYRRPLTATEREILQGVYDGLRPEQGARPAFAAVMQVLLQAPATLYVVERGVPGDGEALRLSSFELASRLALFLRNSIPDDELRAAAVADGLQSTEAVEAQARRLVQEDAALGSLHAFHRDWLRAYTIGRDSREHPLFSNEVQAALTREVDAFVDHVFTEGDGSYRTLMTTSRFPVEESLGALYGVSADGSPVDVPDRHGLLTLASVMGGFAEEDHVATIRRGAFMREAVLCGDVLTLPAGVDTAAALESTADLPTARDRITPIAEQTACSGCHNQINPVGLAFENYDHLGAWRDTENGAPIDAGGRLMVNGLDGRFADIGEFIQIVAESEDGLACYATQMFRFAMGRHETAEDACTLAGLQQRFIDSGGDIRDLMVAIATSRPFTTRAPVRD